MCVRINCQHLPLPADLLEFQLNSLSFSKIKLSKPHLLLLSPRIPDFSLPPLFSLLMDESGRAAHFLGAVQLRGRVWDHCSFRGDTTLVCLYAEGDLISDEISVNHTRTKVVLKFWRSPLHYPGQRSILQFKISWKTRLNICLCM